MVVFIILSVLVALALRIYSTIETDLVKKILENNKLLLLNALQIYLIEVGIPEGGKAPPGGWKQAIMPYLQEWPSHPLGILGDYVISGTYPDYKVEFVPE
ncbi:MAG TPA: hypothetical protein PK733_03920 [Clostridiales bacterium]|nr:hypothetical protein [Clostridiales bacterium]